MPHTRQAADEPIEPIVPETIDPPVKVPLKIEDWLSVLILGGLALITFTNVLVRYLTNNSFAWTEEISVFLLIVLTMTAGATAFVRNQHIRIEIFADGGSPQRLRKLAIISSVVVLLFFVLLTVLSARMAIDDYTWGDTSPAIGVPNWWYTIWMPILATAISLRMLGMLRRLLRGEK
jgi:TRAP-type C4-dicarboxylate transport system permease small subunit